MSNKDLINLGFSPDSGTGDTARRGGEKINRLFSDIYTQFGDNPVGQDPDGPFYGYRRPFYEYEYKVGELHPAGRFIPVGFKSTNTLERLYDRVWGYGHDQNGNLIDSDGDGIPDIYRDSEWYFLSRGERIDADFRDVDSDGNVHFVLPIGAPGDQIIIRDGFGTWNNTINDKGIHVSFWTTPFQFRTKAQVEEWQNNTGVSATDLDSDVVAIRDPLSGEFYSSNWHKVKTPAEIEASYPRLDQPFATSRSTDPYDGRSKTFVVNKRRYQFEFLFTNYQEGWIIRQVALDAADVGATLLQFGNRLEGVDSDLERGLYISTDSDIRHTVPIFRRTPDGRGIHGNLSLRGDYDSIMTTIDSEDTPLINDPRSAFGGDTVQPLTTTVRFKLRDSVKVKDDLFVGRNLEVGGHAQIGETLTIDSDLAYFNNNVQIREMLTVDSDVLIKGQLYVDESSIFRSDVRFEQNVWIGGDSTSIQTESLRVRDNIITLSTNSNNAPLIDTGMIFQRFDPTAAPPLPLTHSDTVYNPYLIWNEQNDQFKFGETVSSDSEQNLTRNRTYLSLGRGEFVLYDSENTPRIVFEKANNFPDAVKGSGADLQNPNERPTVEPDFEFHVKANATFGRDSDDVVVFNSRIMSNLVPFGDEKFNLGDSDNKWNDLYLSGNTIYLGAIKIKEEQGKIFVTDSDDNRIDLVGADFTTDNLTVDSDVTIGGNSALLGELAVSGHARFDSDINLFGNLFVGDASVLGGHVRILEGLIVDSDVIVSADLRVDSDAYIEGELYVGENVQIKDDLTVSGHARFDSDVSITGNLLVNQNVGIRDDLRVTGNVQFDSDLSVAGKFNLEEDAVLSGAVFIGEGLVVDSDVIFGSDLRVDSDVIIKGQLTVGEQVKIDDSLYVADNAYFDSDVFIRGNLTVEDHIVLGGQVLIQEGLTVDSDVRFGNDLRVDSDAIIKGQLYVGENVQIHDTLYVKGRATFDSDVHITGSIKVGKEVTFSDDVLFLDNAQFDSDVVILGSLTVNGSTTTVTAANLAVGDNFITLNRNQTTPLNDTGFIFTRYDSDNVSTANWNAILEWDETTDSFIFGQTDNSGIDLNPLVTKSYASFTSGTSKFYDTSNSLRVTETYGATNTTTISGNYVLDVSGDITFDADGNNFIFKNGGGADTSTVTFADNGDWTQTFPSNFTIDAVGDITFDADGNDFVFKNGAGADTSTVTFADNGSWTQTFPSNYTIDAVGDITFDADGNDFVFKNGGGNDTSTATFANDGNWTQTFPSNYTMDVVGDITLSADGDNIVFDNGAGADNITFTLGNDSTISASGDLIINNTGDDLIVRDRLTIGTSATAANGPFVFDTTGAIDPDGLNRPTLGGDGTGVIDGGTF